MASYRECEACHGRLIMARGPDGTIMLDWNRDGHGEYAATQTAAGAWLARRLAQGEPPAPHEQRHNAHYGNSPQCRPPAPQQRQAAADVTTQLDTWRKAEAARKRAQRRRRPRQAPITGIRVNPGRRP